MKTTHAPRATGRRRPPTALAITVVALLIAVAMALGGIGSGFDAGLQAMRDAVRTRPATGRLLLVEVDARSLAELDRWPWPRGLHASAIEALSRAGARMIAFDVDFTARSVASQDAALARAVERSPVPIVMPTFRQADSSTGRGEIENLPLPAIRRHAMLASVNIYADPDGLIRAYPYGVVTAGVPRPSIGAMLADAAGAAGQTFPIDGAIDPQTIARVSFVDLIRGRVPARTIAGRSVLIGATAIELGDRYPMPRHGVLPGAIIQLLAADTLLQGTSPVGRGASWPIAALALALPLLLGRTSRRRTAGLIGLAAALLLLPLGLEVLRLGVVAVAPALAGLLFAAIASAIGDAIVARRLARSTDADTGLGNARALAEIAAESDGGVVVVLRIANHGEVAGVLGRAQATEFVAQIARRLADGEGCTVHRVEESALGWVVEEGDCDIQTRWIDRVAALLKPPFDIGGRRIEAVLGFGVADLGSGGDPVAHSAMAADRALGRGVRMERHSLDYGEESDWRLSLADELDRAMTAGDIWVAYQPKLDIRSGRVVATEALVRWRHPTRGAIPPDAFIPALEERGRIADLTLCVLERALADWTIWANAGETLGVAVNVSALLPADPDFIARLDILLARFTDAVPHLTLEVTESAAMADPDTAVVALEGLARRGIGLSIDDYGTGQSTLSYLKRLPAHEIKIDKSFVLGLETSRGDQAMVRSTIELAHELGYKVVAEGIETAGVLAMLSGYGCDTGQGWFIGRPMPAADLLQSVQTRERVAA